MKTRLHVEFQRKANKEVLVAEISAILQMDDVAATEAARQPITYQTDRGIRRVVTGRYEHCLRHTERRVYIDALDLLHSETLFNTTSNRVKAKFTATLQQEGRITTHSE